MISSIRRNASFYGLVGMLLIILAVQPHSILAQEISTEPIIVDGVNHAIQYPTDISPSQVQTVRRVLENTLSRYSLLFGIRSPSMGIIFTHEAPHEAGTLAAAGPRRNPSDPFECYVYIYTQTENRNLSAFRFTIAHEIAHCFQFAVNPASIAAVGNHGVVDPNLWWVEGTAEWLASRIYPPIGNPIAQNIARFYTISSQSPLIYRYENYWFFSFYGQHFGESAVMSLIRNIPSTESEHIRYLEGVQATPDMMVAYGRLVQRRALRRQPAYPPADHDHLVSTARALPYDVPLIIQPLSISPITVELPTPAAGKGIKVAQTGGTDLGYRALLPDGTLITSEGTSVCGADLTTRMTFMIARGYNTSDGGGTLTITESDCGSSDCFVGEWVGLIRQQVGSAMGTMMLEPTNAEEIKFTITADGSITGQVVGVQDISNGFVSFNTPAPVHGNFTATGAPVELYLGWKLVPVAFNVPITGAVTSGGGTIDANQNWTFHDGGLTATIKFPAYQTIECGNMTTTPDGQSTFNYLGFHEGTVDDVIAGTSFPIFELSRVGSF